MRAAGLQPVPMAADHATERRGPTSPPSTKPALRDRLQSALTDELDRHLAAESTAWTPRRPRPTTTWRASHQPFHWFVEFYGIMSKGGFDVVIGNPPYVEYSKAKSDYAVTGYRTEPCGNLYAFVVERNKDCAQGMGAPA